MHMHLYPGANAAEGGQYSQVAAERLCVPLEQLARLSARKVSITVLTSRRAWWGKQDSNLRRLRQRIYSPPPLPLGTFPRARGPLAT